LKRLLLLNLLVILLAGACGGGATPANDTQAQTTPATPELLVATPDPRAELAAAVNGEAISLQAMERQLAIFEAGVTAEAADRQALMGAILERLIEQKLIEQAATEFGILITDEQVAAEIGELEAAAAAQGYNLDDFFVQQGINPEDYPLLIREALLTEAVNERVTTFVPDTAAQVHARHILTPDEAAARSVLQQLEGGASFAELALQYSLDPSTREAGGDLGWVSPGDLLQAEVEAAIFALPANAREPEPVKSVLGYHIVEVLERAEERPLDPAQLAERRQQAWQSWLDQRRAEATIVRYVGPNAQ